MARPFFLYLIKAHRALSGRVVDKGERDSLPDNRNAESHTEKIGAAIFVLAIAFLAFLGGAYIMLAEIFPSELIRNSYRAGTALLEKKTQYLDPLRTDQWRPARTAARGVTVPPSDQAYPGLTLYTSGDGPYARLIDMEGQVVHEWRRPFSTVWNESAAVKHPQPDDLIYMRKARLLPNGDLLAIYEAAGDTPWGYGLVKLDRDSGEHWAYLGQAHHDFDMAPDGRILLLTHAFTDEVIKEVGFLGRPRLDDFLVVLSPEGQELKKISLTKAVVRSKYKPLLHAIPYFTLEDPLHTNTVKFITKEKAAYFPFGKEGQVLLCFRELGAVAVLDTESEEIVWAVRGPWLGQHASSLVDGGRILLFDNLGNFEPGSRSRVIEFDPTTFNIVWSYAGDVDRPLESEIRASAERLPNGNTLITESDGGRLLEVSPQGEIVWEYVNPVRGGDGDSRIPVVSWGQRIAPEALDPEFLTWLQEKKRRSS